MTFMNAKEARPVDDPKALVPFGWAPGGYHCAACSTCGEAHAGSDKRSMRCQDCAEALRDKRADEPTPTTRETADHAELARLAEIAMSGPLSGTIGAETAYRAAANPATVLSLLSEIAALRVDRDEWRNWYRKASVEINEQTDRVTQAERQRDELRKALERIAHTPDGEDGLSLTECVNIARQALANQGADQ